LPFTPNEAQLFQISNNLFTENTARSQNEQQLYAAWQKSELEKQQMYNANQNLREELNVITFKIERLKSILKPSEAISLEEEISDNDLANDTKWVRVENNKKKEVS
jgi:DNA repair ATPase RecN